MDNLRKKIAVAGTGYVGLSLAAVLATKHDVVAVDILQDRVDCINKGKSPIREQRLERLLSNSGTHLFATTDAECAYMDAEFVVIAVPTNYDEITGFFDVSKVDSVICSVLSINPNATIVIKSTIPIGYTKEVRNRYAMTNSEKPIILFSPEFLREGNSVYDLLRPSRIIVGYDDASQLRYAKAFAELLKGVAEHECPIYLMGSTEAEAVKLFANSYLAMRVAFFNELDSFAESQRLNAKDIINGVCDDFRIGRGYNNPSFGYGGYCFPKDTKQLLATFADKNVPQKLITAIVESNATRKGHVANQINVMASSARGTMHKTFGIYRLAMKSGSDNHRQSAILDVISSLLELGNKIIVFEPSLGESDAFANCEIIPDLGEFKRRADIIVANRYDDELKDVLEKVYTRDIFGRD